jgi:predicted DNA-binding protein with PD1-like motif
MLRKSDHEGTVRAGHLLADKVFAAEVHLIEMMGEKVVRKHDVVTGLSLWDISSIIDVTVKT